MNSLEMNPIIYHNAIRSEAIQLLNGLQVGCNYSDGATGDYVSVSAHTEFNEGGGLDLMIFCHALGRQLIDWRKMPPIVIKCVQPNTRLPTYICRRPDKKGYSFASLSPGDFQLKVKEADEAVVEIPEGLIVTERLRADTGKLSFELPETVEFIGNGLGLSVYTQLISGNDEMLVAFETYELHLEKAKVIVSFINKSDESLFFDPILLELKQHPLDSKKLFSEWVGKPFAVPCKIVYTLFFDSSENTGCK